MNIRSMADRYASIDWNSPRVKAFDYALAAGTVAYGFYVWSMPVVVLGAAGVAATAYGLNARIVRGVQGVVRRRTGR
jgi:hypothetical protein